MAVEMAIYCPICNKSSDDIRFVGEFCQDCVIDMLKRKIPRSAEVYQCKSCERIRVGMDNFNLTKSALTAALKTVIKTPGCDFKVVSYSKTDAVLRFKCAVDGDTVGFDDNIELRIRKWMCKDCVRRVSGYYEALVQLRGDAFLVERMLKKIEAYVDKNNAFVAKKEKINSGYDIYISDKKLVSYFFSLYKLKPERSYTLYGMKKGKKLYRHIYSLKL
ncbi:MAG: NMD3-related protein [Candidatus Micrarchaeaceae archaeon]